MWRIARTSNFDKDWYDEEFVENIPALTEGNAKHLASILNSFSHTNSEHFWRAVPADYKLSKGIQP